MTTFHGVDLPDLSGTTAVVTGANSGIGRSVSRALATAGARVVLAVRSVERGDVAANGIIGITEVRELDLADLESVRTFAANWEGPIDLLINNAGVSAPTLTRTADGFEAKFGINHLGHFALTNLLLPHITGRVVTVASQAERLAQLDFADLNWEHRPYQPARAYNDSKFANMLFTAELQRRLTAAGSSVRANAAHPGLVATNIYHHEGPRRPIDLVWSVAIKLMAQDADHGALPVLYAAVADLPGNSFTGPRHLAHMRGAPQLIDRSEPAQDPDLARRLWNASEQLTGIGFPLSRTSTR
ncbi:oxidoreductase [Nocardia vaccinii]|uniref:oxidoreductase n=1 Tax=Nocardia vaccinii TaxID=1822 RepID=UPI00082E684E|nr:oxidoreductase [Nocardia vaccinii]